jgi:cyclopropane-fatty-acyl-phospholipid synthase
MSGQGIVRGKQLTSGGRAIAVGPGWIARLWSGGIARLLSKYDSGLARGKLEVTLPDGTKRVLGGRQNGFQAQVSLRDVRAVVRLATAGSVGCYQGYEAGEWESEDPVSLFALFVDNATSLGDAGRAGGPWRMLARVAHKLRRNTREGSLRNIHAHYDLGNDFYQAWLDPTMSYSSARFENGEGDLETAQQRKIESIAARLGEPQSVLEIGCGWGALSKRFAETGAAVTAISLSDEQLAWASAHNAGPAIDFRKQDYRDVSGQFDGIASVEMVEAVGQEYWPTFFDCIARCLKPGGRAAIQYIAMRDDIFDAYARSADFIQTYVFPGGMLIRESAFQKLAAERGLEWRDGESFGLDYAETLRLWRIRFDQAVELERLPKGFDQRFIGLWRFYLMYCEGGFRGGAITVSQVTLVKRPA